MMHDPIYNCATCAWWNNVAPVLATGIRRAAGSEQQLGTCEVDAPVVVRLAGAVTSQFPETHATRRCGRWAPKVNGGPDDGERVVVPFSPAANRVAA